MEHPVPLSAAALAAAEHLGQQRRGTAAHRTAMAQLRAALKLLRTAEISYREILANVAEDELLQHTSRLQ